MNSNNKTLLPEKNMRIFNPSKLNSDKGFTLVELVTVIIVLGILATVTAPKFLNMQEDAQAAAVKGTAAAFKSGIDMAHMHWLIKHGNGEQDNFHTYAHNYEGTVDFNKYGWPAQHYWGNEHTAVDLTNSDDCESVWRIMFQQGAPMGDYHQNHGEPTVSDVSSGEETDYKSLNLKYAEGEEYQCRYFYRKNNKFSIFYDSNTGEVKFEQNIPYPNKKV